MVSTSVLTCPFPCSENSISGHLLKFIVQLFLLDLCFTTNNQWGKRGAQFFINLHGTNRKTKTNERYFRRDSISHCLHLGLLELLAFSLHGMSVCTVDSIYLRLLLGTLHSLNFTSDCAGGCTWTLYLRTIPMNLLLKTTPMNFTREGIQWTLLGNNSNELYISEKKNFTWEPFFKAAQDYIGVTSS